MLQEPTTDQLAQRLEFTSALRAVAQHYDDNPLFPLPLSGNFDFGIWASSLGLDRDDITKLISLLHGSTKTFADDKVYVEKVLCGYPIVKLSLNLNREAVCTKRIVGVRTIKATYIPARTEEIVEWDCLDGEPLLKVKAGEAVKQSDEGVPSSSSLPSTSTNNE